MVRVFKSPESTSLTMPPSYSLLGVKHIQEHSPLEVISGAGLYLFENGVSKITLSAVTALVAFRAAILLYNDSGTTYLIKYHYDSTTETWVIEQT